MFRILCSFFPSQNSCEKHPCHDGFISLKIRRDLVRSSRKLARLEPPGGRSRRTKICQVKGEMILISMAHHATGVGNLRVLFNIKSIEFIWWYCFFHSFYQPWNQYGIISSNGIYKGPLIINKLHHLIIYLYWWYYMVNIGDHQQT